MRSRLAVPWRWHIGTAPAGALRGSQLQHALPYRPRLCHSELFCSQGLCATAVCSPRCASKAVSATAAGRAGIRRLRSGRCRAVRCNPAPTVERMIAVGPVQLFTDRFRDPLHNPRLPPESGDLPEREGSGPDRCCRNRTSSARRPFRSRSRHSCNPRG